MSCARVGDWDGVSVVGEKRWVFIAIGKATAATAALIALASACITRGHRVPQVAQDSQDSQ